MSDNSQQPSLSFRPDIQGLRAIAIIIVVACHAGMPGFSGGYIGVDIFFVLSGFLISGLLLKEIEKTGKIHFLNFYTRRFKRLLPALLLMLSTSIIFAWFILAPFEQVAQIESSRYVPLWLSNFYYSFTDIDYFGQDASTNLFLHTWSLGVEEQFYLLWPILIFITAVIWKHRSQSTIFLFSLLGISSLLLCLFLSFSNQPLAFYLMPSRAWQFSLGALVYILGNRIRSGTNALSDKQALWSGICGLGLILTSTVFYHESMVYPGSYAFLPSIGTAGLLLAGYSSINIKALAFLKSPAFQYIGNISYSWYLWHWPVLVFGAIIINNIGIFGKIILILFSFIIASLAYVFVENPIRHSRSFSSRPVIPLLFACCLMAVSFVGINYWGKIAFKESQQVDQLFYQQVRNTLPVIYNTGCDDWFNSSRVVACVYGSENAERTAVLLGDSIGAQWFSAFARPFVESGWRFIVYTKSSCPIATINYFYERIGRNYIECTEWRFNVVKALQQQNVDILLLGSAATYPFTEAQWHEGTTDILSKVSVAAENTYIIRGTFQLQQDGPSCLARKQWQPGFFDKLNSCDSIGESQQDAAVFSGLQLAASQYSNVHMLDLNSINCPDNLCSAIQDGVVVYRDFQHLSDIYVNSISKQVIELMSKIYPVSIDQP